MKFRFAFTALLTAAAFCAGGRVLAQNPGNAPETKVDSATRTQVIENLLKMLDKSYVLPEAAGKMTADIRARLGRKEYDSVTSAEELARKLTEDLQAVSPDRHLMVHYSPAPIPDRAANNEMPAEEKEFRRPTPGRRNHANQGSRCCRAGARFSRSRG